MCWRHGKVDKRVRTKTGKESSQYKGDNKKRYTNPRNIKEENKQKNKNKEGSTKQLEIEGAETQKERKKRFLYPEEKERWGSVFYDHRSKTHFFF